MRFTRVFLTGATGYIGGSVARLLLDKGYQVTALIRKPADEAALQAMGITTVRGSLHQLDLVARLSKEADIVVNTADADNPYVITTILSALAGSGKTFIHTSGSSIVADWALGNAGHTRPFRDIPENPVLEKKGRVAIDREVVQHAAHGIRSIVVCPTMVYGEGLGIKKDSIQVPLLMRAAQQYGKGVYIGAGENRWSNVHIKDLAQLYLLAIEQATAGSFFYAENGVAQLKEIAETISRTLGLQGTMSIPVQEAIELWGLEGAILGLASNSLVSAEAAWQQLNWQPVYHSLLHDIETSGLPVKA
jgi:nucleoside-diphosphate-sugar epimerase